MNRFARWLPAIMLAASAFPAVAQKYPTLNTTYSGTTPTTTVTAPGGIWSKNMELICPLPMVNGGEIFPVARISRDGTSSTEKQYLVVAECL